MIEKLLFMAHQLPADLTNETTGIMMGTANWAYNVTQGAWWSLLFLGWCFVLFMSTSRYNTPRAFGFASVSGMFGAMMLATLKLMPWWIASGFIIMGGIGMVAMIMNKN